MLSSGDRRVTLAVLAVAAHFLANALHGAIHGLLSVVLTPIQIGFVVLVGAVAPLGACWLLAGGRYRAGGLALSASMTGSLAFGVVFHFLLRTPDHVHAVPSGPWHGPFEWTAVGVALANLGGLLAGAWIAVRSR